jgi:hypothetical protein
VRKQLLNKLQRNTRRPGNRLGWHDRAWTSE